MQRYLSINTTVKPFDDVRVRQAINYAINKEALCKVAFAGYAVPSATIYPAEIPGALKLGPWPYDPKKARELLKEAGYPNGFTTEIWSGYSNSTSAKVVQFLQQQLAQVVAVTASHIDDFSKCSFIHHSFYSKDFSHEEGVLQRKNLYSFLLGDFL